MYSKLVEIGVFKSKLDYFENSLRKLGQIPCKKNFIWTENLKDYLDINSHYNYIESYFLDINIILSQNIANDR
jgi:hypothetical protein